MFRSYKIGAPFGVEIKIHGSLLAVLAAITFFTLVGSGILAAGHMALLLGLIAGCVTLHELGHIAAAAAFGIGTTGLTLYPIGGIARLTREARSGLEEVVVAAAGPAVNVILASFAALGMVLVGGGFDSLLGTMVLINLGMAIFNLVPAYPMDGGRIFRGALWNWVGKRRATLWAARGGQVFAGLFALAGLLLPHPTLMIIGVFIFFQASAEYKRAEQSMVREHPRVMVERVGENSINQGIGPYNPSGSDSYYSEGPRRNPERGKVVIIKTPFGFVQRGEL
jgi:Zn-dependent protease